MDHLKNGFPYSLRFISQEFADLVVFIGRETDIFCDLRRDELRITLFVADRVDKSASQFRRFGIGKEQFYSVITFAFGVEIRQFLSEFFHKGHVVETLSQKGDSNHELRTRRPDFEPRKKERIPLVLFAVHARKKPFEDFKMFFGRFNIGEPAFQIERFDLFISVTVRPSKSCNLGGGGGIIVQIIRRKDTCRFEFKVL